MADAVDPDALAAKLEGHDPVEGRAALALAAGHPAALARLAVPLAACGLTAAWAEAAARTGSAPVLEAFAEVWHPSDDEVAARWVQAADAAGAAVPEAVRERAARHARRVRRRQRARRAVQGSPAVDRWLRSEVAVRVRCAACGRDAAHLATNVLFDPAAHDDAPGTEAGIYVPTVLSCPHCEAADAYEVLAPSVEEIVIRALAAARRGGEGHAVALGSAGLADGTPIRRPSEGLRILEGRAEARPDDPASWRALASFALRADRLDRARAAWRRGAALEADFDCALALAVDAVAGASDGGADPFDAAARAVARLPKADPERRPIQAAQLAEALRALARAEAPLTLAVAGVELDLGALRDWSRLGELLAIASEASLRRAPASDPAALTDAFGALRSGA